VKKNKMAYKFNDKLKIVSNFFADFLEIILIKKFHKKNSIDKLPAIVDATCISLKSLITKN